MQMIGLETFFHHTFHTTSKKLIQLQMQALGNELETQNDSKTTIWTSQLNRTNI